VGAARVYWLTSAGEQDGSSNQDRGSTDGRNQEIGLLLSEGGLKQYSDRGEEVRERRDPAENQGGSGNYQQLHELFVLLG
jgi:hypothetical protein